MHFLQSLFVALLSASALAAPLMSRQDMDPVCTEKLQRKAWHTLSADEKQAYIDAELCLMWQREQKTGLPHAISRFDDLVKVHQVQSNYIHNTGWFLPFHRLMMYAHEKLLREECGYTGAQPYWDETRDAGNFANAEILSEEGFGGDGRRDLLQIEPGCIDDGPFANYTLHTGPGFRDTEHCITRRFNDIASLGSSESNVNRCYEYDTFDEAWPCIEGRPHSGGHSGIGGEMSNAISSPGDPLFYMHHTFIDRIWWLWQQEDLDTRLTAIAGYTSQDQSQLATLDDEMSMYGVVPSATIRDVMDIGGPLLCYEYV